MFWSHPNPCPNSNVLEPLPITFTLFLVFIDSEFSTLKHAFICNISNVIDKMLKANLY
ncbi:hypothetical protein P20480_0938 [Pseudoalteromonas sp. BSi20480]|nr:hypothetical protein P20480_0938 [Pseudoalteromonas sp. BSi20480]